MVKYGTKHIIESMEKNKSPLKVQEILVCGGLSQNRVFLQSQANVVLLPVYTSSENDPVLIGSAMLGAAASLDQRYPSLKDAIMAMASNAQTTHPSLDLNE